MLDIIAECNELYMNKISNFTIVKFDSSNLDIQGQVLGVSFSPLIGEAIYVKSSCPSCPYYITNYSRILIKQGDYYSQIDNLEYRLIDIEIVELNRFLENPHNKFNEIKVFIMGKKIKMIKEKLPANVDTFEYYSSTVKLMKDFELQLKSMKMYEYMLQRERIKLERMRQFA